MNREHLIRTLRTAMQNAMFHDADIDTSVKDIADDVMAEVRKAEAGVVREAKAAAIFSYRGSDDFVAGYEAAVDSFDSQLNKYADKLEKLDDQN